MNYQGVAITRDRKTMVTFSGVERLLGVDDSRQI